MKRHAINRLQEWKEDPNRLPLIIRGARQVGKTWLMQEFGRTAFERCAYINFDRNERMQNLFSGDFDVDRILRGLAIESGMEIDPENTLIILDEIQEVPAALQSLKYFCEDNRHNYYILAAESLLGIAMHEGTSFPVGKVDSMDLAQKIGTYETSIQPFEDCCTVFLPKHPVTKPRLENILKSESLLDREALVEAALETKETKVILPE